MFTAICAWLVAGAAIVNAKLFKNAGHGVQRDDPEKIDRVVWEFIAS